MTKEEAVKIIYSHAPGGPSEEQSKNWVGVFQRLGMLKLDESKGDDGEIGCRLLNACHGVPYLATCINETLAKAGLEVVLKK